MTYEESLKQLEDIVQKMEAGDYSIDELAEKLAAVADNYGRPYEKDDKSKPNNRIVYTIFAGDSYIDLNVIKEL